MQVIQDNKKDRDKEPSKLLKILLFWSIFLFIVFLAKRIVGFPQGGFDFIIKNVLSFVCAVILSGTMLHFLSVKSLKLSILIIWILTVIIVVA